MITLDNIVLEDEEGAVRPPLSFTIGKGLFGATYEDRGIYEALDFRFSKIKSGTISVDGTVLSKDSASGSIFLLEVHSRDVVNMTAAFALAPEDDANARKAAISKEISALRGMPYYTDDEKAAKMNAIVKILLSHGLSYLLLDSNDEVNGRHFTLITNILSAYFNDLTVIVLGPKKPLEVVHLDDEEYSALKEAGLIPSDKTAGESRPQDKPSRTLIAAFRSLFKREWVNLLLSLSFAILCSAAAFIAGCLFYQGENTLSAVIFAIVGAVFFAEYIYGLTFYTPPESSLMDVIMNEVILSISAAVGSGIGYGIAYGLASGQILLSSESLTLVGLSGGIAVSIAMFLLSYAMVPVAKGLNKIKLAFRKKPKSQRRG